MPSLSSDDNDATVQKLTDDVQLKMEQTYPHIFKDDPQPE